MVRLEEELKKLRDESRFGSIEYHIQNLTVENIQNGILDLGVHMGNELDKRIQTNAESNRLTDDGDLPAAGPSGLQDLDNRLLQTETDLREVKDQLQGWEERIRQTEEQFHSLEQRLRNLEVLHW
jgi:DNA repair exonuclease SbcCD ATPase subunit